MAKMYKKADTATKYSKQAMSFFLHLKKYRSGLKKRNVMKTNISKTLQNQHNQRGDIAKTHVHFY